jgi:DNA-binding MarR family transcriptional regulator
MTKKITTKKKVTKKRKRVTSKKPEPPAIDMSALDPLIGFHLRRAMATLIRSYNRNVHGGKVRPGLASLVELVATNHGASQIDLSRALQVDKATLVALIDTAERNGWLRRQRSTVDRRRHEVIVTPKGEKVAADLNSETRKNERKFQKLFTEEELANLIEYLQRIYSTPP